MAEIDIKAEAALSGFSLKNAIGCVEPQRTRSGA